MRKRRYRKENRTKYLIVLLFIAVGITYFAYPRFYSRFISVDFDPGKFFEISPPEGNDAYDSFDITAGKLVHLQGQTLKLIDGEGKTVWSRTVKVERPLMSACGEIIAICDMDKNKVFGLDDQGELIWELTPAGNVEWMDFANTFLWIKSTKQEQEIIEVLDTKGEVLTYLNTGAVEVTGVSVSADGNYIAVSTADVRGGRFSSDIALYKRDGNIIWAKDQKEGLVFDLRITDKGDILVLTEKTLVSYDIRGNILWQKPLNGYISMAVLSGSGSSIVSLAEDYRVGVPEKVGEKTLVYSENGETLKTIDWKDRVSGFSEGEGYVALYSGRRIRIIDMKTRDIIEMTTDKDISGIFLLEDSQLACVSGDRVYIDKIKR